MNYKRINSLAEDKRWGNLLVDEVPVDQSHISEASEDIKNLSRGPFVPIKELIPRKESRQMRVARSSVFREQVKQEYQFKCAVSGLDISTPAKMYEVESAHIVPVSRGGSDDVQNGIALAQTIHWAFDKGLFGISEDRTVYVPNRVRTSIQNDFIRKFASKSINEAKTGSNQAHPDAFKWHMDNVVSQWE